MRCKQIIALCMALVLCFLMTGCFGKVTYRMDASDVKISTYNDFEPSEAIVQNAVIKKYGGKNASISSQKLRGLFPRSVKLDEDLCYDASLLGMDRIWISGKRYGVYLEEVYYGDADWVYIRVYIMKEKDYRSGFYEKSTDYARATFYLELKN